jgi:hypothetical protein
VADGEVGTTITFLGMPEVEGIAVLHSILRGKDRVNCRGGLIDIVIFRDLLIPI